VTECLTDPGSQLILIFLCLQPPSLKHFIYPHVLECTCLHIYLRLLRLNPILLYLITVYNVDSVDLIAHQDYGHLLFDVVPGGSHEHLPPLLQVLIALH
jgi:hypothetical protein